MYNEIANLVPTESQLDAFKETFQEEVRGREAKTAARLCASAASDLATYIANNDYFKFAGNMINSADWFWEAYILSKGVSQEECRRRMKAARKMMMEGSF